MKGNRQENRRILSGRGTALIRVACRYDYFEQLYGGYLEGCLEKFVSAGHRTDLWLERVFGTYRENSVYVAGNPQTHFVENRFYEVLNVWGDVEKGTTPPFRGLLLI